LYPSEEFLSINLVSALLSFSGEKYEYGNALYKNKPVRLLRHFKMIRITYLVKEFLI